MIVAAYSNEVGDIQWKGVEGSMKSDIQEMIKNIDKAAGRAEALAEQQAAAETTDADMG